MGDSSIMMIDGSNNEFQLKLYKASDFKFIDEYEVYFGLSKNEFNWISPIEEMTTGFFSNLNYQGSTIGNLVANQINILPQREDWFFYKLGLVLKKDINISPKIAFFYNVDVVLVDTEDYRFINEAPDYNFKFISGLKLNIYKHLTLSFSASIYKNNLFGYEDISFTQRSEHHFDKSFGSLNSSLKFTF
ncbi:hypothetical protein N9B16_02890 [Gammaproteobacteria bacterium]|nr:hypothetical protein [Gammaproteobacteria bacterium]MDA8865347.1 hypothetical protein [Gammaproteobacteria bacterium]